MMAFIKRRAVNPSKKTDFFGILFNMGTDSSFSMKIFQ